MPEWKKNQIHNLEIQGYTAEGMGVARLEGRVIFVPGTVRGERWQVRLEKVNKSVAWGKGTQLLSPSPHRIAPNCPLTGRCGGCQFRHMDYTEELRAKATRLQDALMRLGGVTLDLPPVLGAEVPERYRNKVQFPVAMGEAGVNIGYYRPRSHQVLPVEDCMLQPEAIGVLRHAFQRWMEEYDVAPYDEATGQGLIRHLYVRTNQRGELLGCVVANARKLPQERALVETLRQSVPKLVGIVCNTNQKDTNVILGAEYRTIWGRDWLEETLCGLDFRLSVPSFFQVNWAQTQRLYAIALHFAALTGKETVLDLYCGIGTISLCMARLAGRVIGAELVAKAVEDAKENARRNGITNAEFICADAGDAASELARRGIHPDVICIDPPRKGLAPHVPAQLAGLAPERIVYVSCDPATLARDVKRLGDLGYQVGQAQGVDLFPRTAHVETVVLLERKRNSAKSSGTLNVGLDHTTEKDQDL